MNAPTRHCKLVALAALVLLAAGPAGADTYIVDRFDDSTDDACTLVIPNDCSLRGAIIRANGNPGDDIVVLLAGTYTLTIPGAGENLCRTGDLDVTDTVLIVGHGPELTAVNAGGDGGVNDRVFDVYAPGKQLALRGLTVTGGSPDTGPGGGIHTHEGSLRLQTCTVTGNEAFGGSGTAVHSTSDAPGDLTEIVDSWITGNTGQYSTLDVGVARIERTTVSGNTQGSSYGAAQIFGEGSLLLDSTIEGSTGSTGIPAVLIWGTASVIEGCTLVGVGGPALGVATSGSATVSNTLIAGWCGGGQPTSLGGNLESPGDTCGLGASDLVNVPDPGLSALGFFGGPTPVYQPLTGSPAVDAPVAAANCPDEDQRGLSRPRDGDGISGAVCDIGAVELAAPGEIFVDTSECGFTTGWSEVVP
ncbi:MAG TPA: choice-of-anchor Q domain-containing protein [Thermoanaerobaculales bacterium]|nr:choice-of-anchor Q domain-containing protein [Thermoanaerobaculales bacterium]HQN95630.1 choice-of-anchor Q domain-containing protein [Thermoanaerobaculales bacterium]HQP43587.1 choice-of-anchor Q domain-containing protein [Thermoanaerobaculales bacterium]